MFFNLSLNLAMRSSRWEPQSAPVTCHQLQVTPNCNSWLILSKPHHHHYYYLLVKYLAFYVFQVNILVAHKEIQKRSLTILRLVPTLNLLLLSAFLTDPGVWGINLSPGSKLMPSLHFEPLQVLFGVCFKALSFLVKASFCP